MAWKSASELASLGPVNVDEGSSFEVWTASLLLVGLLSL